VLAQHLLQARDPVVELVWALVLLVGHYLDNYLLTEPVTIAQDNKGRTISTSKLLIKGALSSIKVCAYAI
jgi:hypothetical protein